MYQTETKRLKESVRRNIRRFPSDFMFELTPEEWENLRSQIATSSWGGQRYLPFAFTEQGVAMLSSVLNSEIAIDVNISIMRAFVIMRQFALTYQELSEKLIELEKQHTLLRCVPSLKLRRKLKLRESKIRNLKTSSRF